MEQLHAGQAILDYIIEDEPDAVDLTDESPPSSQHQILTLEGRVLNTRLTVKLGPLIKPRLEWLLYVVLLCLALIIFITNPAYPSITNINQKPLSQRAKLTCRIWDMGFLLAVEIWLTSGISLLLEMVVKKYQECDWEGTWVDRASMPLREIWGMMERRRAVTA